MSAFGYFGSKLRIASKLCGDLPPHNAWVELFCGSAAMTLAKKPAPIEVINDTQGEIVNFFRQLRENGEKLREQIRLTPYSRAEFQNSRIKEEQMSELERARRFFVSAMMAINGSFGKQPGGFSLSNSYSRHGMEARVSRWNGMAEHLEKVVERLKSVRVEDKNALMLFKDFQKRPGTLVYFDPPYFADRIEGYDNDQLSEDFHKELLELALRAKCMVFISSYESDLYSKTLTKEKGWSQMVLKATTKGNNGKDFDRKEIVWFNAQFIKARDNGRVNLRLSAKELRDKKVNPLRIS
jgi:DNA adenine methylase